jgi:hypothetical protein
MMAKTGLYNRLLNEEKWPADYLPPPFHNLQPIEIGRKKGLNRPGFSRDFQAIQFGLTGRFHEREAIHRRI